MLRMCTSSAHSKILICNARCGCREKCMLGNAAPLNRISAVGFAAVDQSVEEPPYYVHVVNGMHACVPTLDDLNMRSDACGWDIITAVVRLLGHHDYQLHEHWALIGGPTAGANAVPSPADYACDIASACGRTSSGRGEYSRCTTPSTKRTSWTCCTMS
jgi:hypothetical protein